jgi:Na+/pantothenate symporter
LYISIGGLVVLAAIITTLGGLRAVIYTETLQMFVIVTGSILLGRWARPLASCMQHLVITRA